MRRKMGKKKYTQEQKEGAIARLTLGESPTKIAKSLKIPYGTVAYWKSNLKKVKEQNGTLGYHAEEIQRFVRKAWKTLHIAQGKLEKILRDVDPSRKSLKDARDLAVIIGILRDKIEKATPQPQLEAGTKRPLYDLTGASKKQLEMIIAKVTLVDKTPPPQLEEGEVIEGESREIKEKKDGD